MSPVDIGNQFVDEGIAGNEFTGLQTPRYRRNRNGFDFLYSHHVRRSDGDEAVAKESATGNIPFHALAREGVVYAEAIFRGAEISTVHTALGAVHTAAPGTVSVVQQLSGEAGQHCPRLCLELEGRNGGGILAEVYHKGFSGHEGNSGSGGEFIDYHHLAILILRCALYIFPGIGEHRLERFIFPEIHLGACAGEYLPRKFIIDFRGGEFSPGLVARQFAGIEGHTVEYAGVLDRTGDTGLPILRIGAENLGGAIVVG